MVQSHVQDIYGTNMFLVQKVLYINPLALEMEF